MTADHPSPTPEGRRPLTRAEQWAEYREAEAAYRREKARFERGERETRPRRPIAPHTPGWCPDCPNCGANHHE